MGTDSRFEVATRLRQAVGRVSATSALLAIASYGFAQYSAESQIAELAKLKQELIQAGFPDLTGYTPKERLIWVRSWNDGRYAQVDQLVFAPPEGTGGPHVSKHGLIISQPVTSSVGTGDIQSETQKTVQTLQHPAVPALSLNDFLLYCSLGESGVRERLSTGAYSRISPEEQVVVVLDELARNHHNEAILSMRARDDETALKVVERARRYLSIPLASVADDMWDVKRGLNSWKRTFDDFYYGIPLLKKAPDYLPFSLDAYGDLQEPQKIPYLIGHLDEISALIIVPGGAQFIMSPIGRLLVDHGKAALPALQRTAANDKRLTSVEYSRQSPSPGHLYTVAEAAQQLIREIERKEKRVDEFMSALSSLWVWMRSIGYEDLSDWKFMLEPGMILTHPHWPLDNGYFVPKAGTSDAVYSLGGPAVLRPQNLKPSNLDRVIQRVLDANTFKGGSYSDSRLATTLIALASHKRLDLVEKIVRHDRLYQWPKEDIPRRLLGLVCTAQFNAAVRMFAQGNYDAAQKHALLLARWEHSPFKTAQRRLSIPVDIEDSALIAREIRRRVSEEKQLGVNLELARSMQPQDRAAYLVSHLHEFSAPPTSTPLSIHMQKDKMLGALLELGFDAEEALLEAAQSSDRLTGTVIESWRFPSPHVLTVSELAEKLLDAIRGQ